MAKEAGMGSTLTIDSSDTTGRDISNDVTNATFNISKADQDVTGLDKSAHERLALLADFSTSISFVFNDASNPSSFGVFANIGSTNVSRTVVFAVSGQTLTNECFFDACNWTRAAGGEMTGTADGKLSNGTVPTWS